MLATAEQVQGHYEYNAATIEYAHSPSSIRRLGYIAIRAEQVSPQEKLAARELAFGDFITALPEMLKTDEEFRNKFDVNNTRIHGVIDGHVVSAYGDPMVWLLNNGVISSEQAAKDNPHLAAQVLRDKCDVRLAERVDDLQPGQTLIGASIEPKKELELYPETYEGILGYRKGLMYIQTYSKVDGYTVVAGSYSVDNSDVGIWREILAEEGIHIPEDADLNTWLDYSQEMKLTAEHAGNLMLKFRAKFYERVDL